MKRSVAAALLAALFLLTAGLASAVELTATVAKITGKAQLQNGADWVPLALGQVLPAGATVSTGFRSELQLKIGPSTVTVKALSRLTVQDLALSGTDAKTDLYLKVGRIDAEVNKSEAVTTQKFTVTSPVATASVRGTAFSFDGVNLSVSRGIVDFIDSRGSLVQVPVGEAARAALPGTRQGLSNNQSLVAQESTTQADSSSDYGWDYYSDDWWGYWDDWSYYDTLDSFWGYDWWSEMPNTHVTIGGIY